MLNGQQSYAHIAMVGTNAVIGLSDGIFNVAPPSSLSGGLIVTNGASHY
jgi:hypothetical protein